MRGRRIVVRIEPGKVCVYTHSISGTVFYVGKGTAGRPFATTGRTHLWRNAVSNRSFDVDIIGWFDTDREAQNREREEIRELNPIVNQRRFGPLGESKFKGNAGRVIFQIAATDQEWSTFKDWCARQTPRRSMGQQVRLMILKLSARDSAKLTKAGK